MSAFIDCEETSISGDGSWRQTWQTRSTLGIKRTPIKTVGQTTNARDIVELVADLLIYDRQRFATMVWTFDEINLRTRSVRPETAMVSSGYHPVRRARNSIFRVCSLLPAIHSTDLVRRARLISIGG